jgi:acyl-CoA synthetase (AMP-forming)/AMP-acid ligase II
VVFGVPDEWWGQTVAVAIVLAPGLSAEQVALAALSQVFQRLASHKRPRRFTIVESFPRTSSGKLERASVCRDALPKLKDVPTT